MKIIVCGLVLLVSIATHSAVAQEAVKKESMTVSDQSGRSIEVVMVYRENNDGSRTVLRLEPRERVKAFFDAACKRQAGPGSEFVEPNGNVRLKGTASFSFTCQEE